MLVLKYTSLWPFHGSPSQTCCIFASHVVIPVSTAEMTGTTKQQACAALHFGTLALVVTPTFSVTDPQS